MRARKGSGIAWQWTKKNLPSSGNFFTLLLFTSCSNPPPAEAPFEPLGEVDIRLELSTNRVHIGQPVEGFLEVYHPPGASVGALESLFNPDLEIPERAQNTEPFDSTFERTRFDFSVSAFEVGDVHIATGKIEVVTTNGFTNAVALPDVYLKVRSLLDEQDLALIPDTNQAPDQAVAPLQKHLDASLRGVREPASPNPLRRIDWLNLLLWLGLLAAAGWFVRTILAYPIRREEPPVPPHIKAARALRALKARDFGAYPTEPFTVELSGILRTYLEERFDLHAPEQTTEEFIRGASDDPRLTKSQREHIEYFLTQCDLVKFAQHVPEREELDDGFEMVVDFVRDTAPSLDRVSGDQGAPSGSTESFTQEDPSSTLKSPQAGFAMEEEPVNESGAERASEILTNSATKDDEEED